MTSPVIITGMHRSGTSLLASILHHAGLHLGDRLLPPGPANPRGYFEDLEFIAFHDEVLSSLGSTFYLEPEPAGEIAPRFRETATGFVETRAVRRAWGWKDPRTSLFLDFWHELAPRARFVFVYRRPEEVIDSLRRRRDRPLQRRYPGAAFLERFGVPRFRARRALELWHQYNERIASFAERHVDRCEVIAFDELERGATALVERLRAAGVELPADVDVVSVVDPGLRANVPPASIVAMCRRGPRPARLLARLDALTAPREHLP